MRLNWFWGGDNFTGANFWLGIRNDFKNDIVGGETVVFEGVFDDVDEFGLELLDVKRVFDADDDAGGVIRNEGGIFEPSGIISGRNFLLDFS